MRIVGNRRGRLRFRLEAVEVQLLDGLLDELVEALGGAAEPAVTARLFPAAYADDDEAAAEFRALTESGLRDARTARVVACRADLVTGPDIDLADPDSARRWIQVLNDLRLSLGTRLGVTEEDEFDPADPDRAVYHWLTAVQDTVVTAMMG